MDTETPVQFQAPPIEQESQLTFNTATTKAGFQFLFTTHLVVKIQNFKQYPPQVSYWYYIASPFILSYCIPVLSTGTAIAFAKFYTILNYRQVRAQTLEPK